MNCKRCHHTDEAHVKDDDNSRSIIRVGGCKIPVCTCRQYVDPIREIDEDAL